MAVVVTHSTPADGTFSATGATAWNANHTLSGLGTMAEQDASNVNITGGSITGVTGVLTGLTVGTTATSGGAAGQIMFDTGSVLQESSNLVWDNTAKRLTISGYSLTGSAANSLLDLSGTWNTSGTPTALKLNVTDTASNASSLLMDLQLGGVTYAGVAKTGEVYSRQNITAAGGLQVLTNGQFGFNNNSRGFIVTNFSNTNVVNLAGTWTLGWSSGTANSSLDTILSRRGAANLRFGAADAAAPVAQTLSVQSVVAGTSNTAGANLTITGSQGTGTGAGGSIIFQVAPAGSSGTAQNALTSPLTIESTGRLVLAGSTDLYADIKFPGANTGLKTGGATVVLMNSNASTMAGWNISAFFIGANQDVYLTRRGAANLRFGAADAAAPVAQTLSVQSVVAGTTNTAGANLTITGSQGTGTGVGGDIIFQTALAGSSGSAQNSLITALRIYSNQTVAVGKAYTVATLPAAGTQGRRAWVTDATSPTFLGALTGGGAVVTPVFDNGTAWVAG